ncbi:MAG TPA: exodeoxyribonuclease VII large subunit [Deltaproteobacteria bacterium]|nr:exodeoxyribonuclease VII large subunit [Candidatus Binatota bacterium]HIL14288.1 exodeoxyribonuclease VII large subunit [Deltaproteobacteria bacterium]
MAQQGTLDNSVTVSELLAELGQTLEAGFSSVVLSGELLSFKQPASGHNYFTMGDGKAAIDCVMWRSAAQKLSFEPEAGDEVVCRGSVSVYSKQGRMQFYARSMHPAGEGAARLALEKLRNKLKEEGLFDDDRKRELPFLPRTIGVVTSRSGAALHDILVTLRRRYAGVRVVIRAATVQGPGAPADLCLAMSELAEFGACDVVILGRGGGASEDLAAFNDEKLVRAVSAFPAPVVSAVGHETDFSLCDFAADRRAATPTAAAELVVPVYSDLLADLDQRSLRLRSAMQRRVESEGYRLRAARAGLKDPALRVAEGRQRSDELGVALERALTGRVLQAREQLTGLASSLALVGPGQRMLPRCRSATESVAVALRSALTRRYQLAGNALATAESRLAALSPLAVLERGYCVATDSSGAALTVASQAAPGDNLDLRLHRGALRAQVLLTTEDE